MNHAAPESSLEAITLPTRIKLFAQAINPTAEWPWWAILLQNIGAGVAAAYTSMELARNLLFWAMVIDFTSGCACGYFKRGGLVARTMSMGLIVKSLSFVVVGHLCQQAWLTVEFMGYTLQIGTAAAISYTIAEWISIAENMDELGAPLPIFVRLALAKARVATDKASVHDKAARALFGSRPKR